MPACWMASHFFLEEFYKLTLGLEEKAEIILSEPLDSTHLQLCGILGGSSPTDIQEKLFWN